jgi:hypothetical protein
MSKLLLWLLLVLSLAANLFLGWQWRTGTSQLTLVDQPAAPAADSRLRAFTLLFIDQVLRTPASGVDPDTRLLLETKVRELQNPTILAQWQKFVQSQTEAEAQAAVIDLLERLVGSLNPL